MLKRLITTNEKISSDLRGIISNVSWLFIERVLTILLSVFVEIYVIRYLGTENFGKLTYSISFVAIFSVMAKLGLDSIVVRTLVQNEKATREILGTAFVLKTGANFAILALIACMSWIINNDPQIRWLTLIIAFGLVFQSFEVIDFWLQSKVRLGMLVKVRSFILILISVTKLLLIALQLPLIAFAWLIPINVFLVSVGMILVYFQQQESIWQWEFRFKQAWELLKDSWPLIFSAALIIIYMKIDQVMLGKMTSNEVVGSYAVAAKLSESWYFIPMIICSSVFPAIIRTKQRSQKEYYDKLQQLYDFMAWISIAVAIPMTFISTPLIILLFGINYASAGSILALHIWASPFVFLGVARSQWLMAENLTHLSLLTTSLGAITNVILNLIFIPFYGGKGSAVATIISYAVNSHLACIFYPPMFATGWMLTKALFIPFRIRQNWIYLTRLKVLFS